MNRADRTKSREWQSDGLQQSAARKRLGPELLDFLSFQKILGIPVPVRTGPPACATPFRFIIENRQPDPDEPVLGLQGAYLTNWQSQKNKQK